MTLELVKKTNGTKSKIASLADMDDKNLVEIEDLNDVSIKAINMIQAKSLRQPFWQPSQFACSKGKRRKGKSSGDKSFNMRDSLTIPEFTNSFGKRKTGPIGKPPNFNVLPS
jgi:hypothetical protein